MIVAILSLMFAAVSPTLPDQMLAAHNTVRKHVGVPPLQWSDKLAAFARNWAETLAARGEFRHRPNNAYGENIFEATNWHPSPAQVVNDWASEAKDYDYRSNSCRGVCGHYTQIVWRATRRVGCGSATRGARVIWVCNYDPPGNYVGQRPY
jgi:pathogenesis-related protein 1